MKNWNTTAKIKALVIALMCIPNLVMPMKPTYNNLPWPMISFMMLVFTAGMVPFTAFVNKIISKKKFVEPHWNDNPLDRNKPLALFQFIAVMGLVGAPVIIIGAAFKYHQLEPFGIMCFLFGAGILAGIRLTLKYVEGGG